MVCFNWAERSLVLKIQIYLEFRSSEVGKRTTELHRCDLEPKNQHVSNKKRLVVIHKTQHDTGRKPAQTRRKTCGIQAGNVPNSHWRCSSWINLKKKEKNLPFFPSSTTKATLLWEQISALHSHPSKHPSCISALLGCRRSRKHRLPLMFQWKWREIEVTNSGGEQLCSASFRWEAFQTTWARFKSAAWRSLQSSRQPNQATTVYRCPERNNNLSGARRSLNNLMTIIQTSVICAS